MPTRVLISFYPLISKDFNRVMIYNYNALQVLMIQKAKRFIW